MNAAPNAPVLLYDGLCGFCDGTVQFILARDPGGRLQFAPLQGEFARELFRRRPELVGVDSLILVLPETHDTAETMLVRSAAVIALSRYLGGVWRALGVLLRLAPRVLRDGAYDGLSRRRFRLFGRMDRCRIPDAHERARFLD